MWQRLCELLQQSAAPEILVVGDYMLDRYVYGDAERISPEAPVPILRVVRHEETLGGAGSVVAALSALGAKASCVGLVGEDPEGRRICELLTACGAQVSGIVPLAHRPTTRKSRLVGLAQHRHRQQLLRIDDEVSDPIDKSTSTTLLRLVETMLARCNAVCIEDYNKGVVTPELAQGVIAAAKKEKLPIIVDPAPISDYSRYAGATILTPNRTESERVIGGKRLRTLAAVRDAAKHIYDACHVEHVCVTLDAEGAALIGPGGKFEHVPTIERDVYDVTGAGDAVLAALSVAIANGATLLEAAVLANITGGLEVEKFGCVPITRDEVVGEILLQHQKSVGKVQRLDQILPELARRRSKHEKIAFTNGCFDLLHAGHVANFAFCKQHADVLVVGLNSDASVRRLNKGGDRPIVSETDRARVLAALSDVDYVVLFDEDTPLSLIQAIAPDVLLKGEDWKDKKVVGQDEVERRGGKVILAPLLEGRSTTRLIEKIREGRQP